MKIATQGEPIQAACWVPLDYQATEGETVMDAPNASLVIAAIKREAQRRVLAATGSSGAEIEKVEDWVPAQLSILSEGARLVRKESRGTATPEQIERLDQLELIGDLVDAIRACAKAKIFAFVGGQPADVLEGWPS